MDSQSSAWPQPAIGDGAMDFDQWLFDTRLDPASEEWLQAFVEGVPQQLWPPVGATNGYPGPLQAGDFGGPPKRRRGRLYKGCQTCRERKIKCDGRRPVCANCERSRRHTCHGYFNQAESPESLRDVANGEPQTPNSTSHDETATARDPPRGALGVQDAALSDNDDQSFPGRPEVRNGADDALRVPDHLPGQTSNGEQLGYVGEDDAGLLQHYQGVVSHILMPTIDPSRNPYLQIYLPLATHNRPSCFHIALRHALIFVAGCQMQQIPNIRTRLLQDTEAHGKEAERLISQSTPHVAGQLDECKYALLAAALSLLQADVFAGETLRCETHLDLAKAIVEQAGDTKYWQSDPTARTLYQMFKCYVVIATTARVTSRHLGAVANMPVSSMQADGSDGSESWDGGEEDIDRLHQPQHNGHAGGPPATSEYNLDISFGISLKTISHLHRALQIEKQLVQPTATEQERLAVDRAVHTLREELLAVERDACAFAAKPDGPDASFPHTFAADAARAGYRPPGDGADALPPVIRDELAENHQWAFHYAVIVFFGRVLANYDSSGRGISSSSYASFDAGSSRPSSSSNLEQRPVPPGPTTPPSSYQTFVAKILDKLENIDCLTRGSSVQPANTLWPVFVATVEACDVPLRRRALILLNRASRRGIGNIARAKELAMEVWRRVDRQVDGSAGGMGLGPVDWRRVMKEMGCAIMLT